MERMWGRGSRGMAVLSVLAALGAAQELPRLSVRVDPGDLDRGWSVVSARLSSGEHLDPEVLASMGDTWRAAVEGPDGERIAAQVEPCRAADGGRAFLWVHWVAEGLTAGSPRTFEIDLSREEQGAPLREPVFLLEDDATGRSLLFARRPVWRHEIDFDPERIEQTYKTFHHVLDGDVVLTKADGGLYPHHRGLFIGWSKTRAGGSTHNFWGNAAGAGHHQRHTGFLAAEEVTGGVLARSVSRVQWLSGGAPIVAERRSVSTWNLGRGRWAHDFEFVLRGESGDVRLDGDPAHAGFQFRAAQEVAEREDCAYILPAGASGGANDTWADCPWAAARIVVEGRAFWIVHMDAPTNPRPTVYNTRAYGRFGAFFRATIPHGEELRLRYRVLVIGGEASPELGRADFERAYRDFATPPVVVVERP